MLGVGYPIAYAEQQQRGIVVAHLPLVAMRGDLFVPGLLGLAPVLLPRGRIARLTQPEGPIGDGVGAQHQQVPRTANGIERIELDELVAVEVYAPDHDRIGFQLGGLFYGKGPQQLSLADVEQATVAHGEDLQPPGILRLPIAFVDGGYLDPKQGGKRAFTQLWLLEPGEFGDVDLCIPRFPTPGQPPAERLLVGGVGRFGNGRLGEDPGPLAGEDARGDTVGNRGDPVLGVGLTGVLILVRMLDVLGQLENAGLESHGPIPTCVCRSGFPPVRAPRPGFGCD